MTAHRAESGLVRRLGGEKFVGISSNAALEQIIPALEDLLGAIVTTPFVTPGGVIRSTISAGTAIRDPYEPFARLYSEPDEAFYRAKRSGKNRIQPSVRAETAFPSNRREDHENIA